MNILLDTHIALWALLDSVKLPSKARNLILDTGNSIYVSVASVWEVAIKHSMKPHEMPISADIFVSKCREAGYSFISLSTDDILYLPHLVNVHKDQFDRALICQAVVRNMVLVTNDSLIRKYPESNILYV